MYLTEEKREAIRKCFEHRRSENKKQQPESTRGIHETEDIRKVSQILFDARDGREVFTPFFS